MATRRSFTFGGLVLALTGASTARAGGLGKLAPAPSGPPPLKWAHRVTHRGRVLTVHVSITNTADGPLEVVTARGPLPGAHVSASIDLEGEATELQPILKGDRREVFMSRMGPIPEWAPLASKEKVEFGPYEFAWPRDLPLTDVVLLGGVDTMQGYSEFRAAITPNPGAKVAS